MKKIIYQRLGKKQIEQERVVDLDANRKTLMFVRKKMIATLEDVKKAFGITPNCARNRLSRLKKSGFLSSRIKGSSKVYFPTKLGFEKMPKDKTKKPEITEKIKEVYVEKIVPEIDKIKFIKEI